MTSLGESMAASGGPVTRSEIAEFVRQSGENAVVQFASGDQQAVANASGAWPKPGDRVWCVLVAGAWLMLGPTTPRAEWGTVVSVTTTQAVVEYPPGSGVQGTFLRPAGVTVSAGQSALLQHSNGGVIVQVFGGVPAPDPTPPAPAPAPPPAVEKTAEFPAQWSGTATPAGFWLPGDATLYTRNSAGGHNYATFGYGDRIRNAIPAGKQILRAAIYMQLAATGSAHQAAAHALTGRSGAPAPLSAFAISPPRSGWLSIPTATAQRLIRGGDARGITFYDGEGSGTLYRGSGAGPAFGKLRLTWI